MAELKLATLVSTHAKSSPGLNKQKKRVWPHLYMKSTANGRQPPVTQNGRQVTYSTAKRIYSKIIDLDP